MVTGTQILAALNSKAFTEPVVESPVHCGRLRPPSQLTSQPLTGSPVWLGKKHVWKSQTPRMGWAQRRDKRRKWRTHSWHEATCEHLWGVLLCGVSFSLFALLNLIELFPELGLPSLPRPLPTCQLAAGAEPGMLGGRSWAVQHCPEFPSSSATCSQKAIPEIPVHERNLSAKEEPGLLPTW